jgi:hypothetical protein
MGAVNTTYTFTATDTITSTKMNNIIDETVMTGDAVLGGSGGSGGLDIASGKLSISANAINSSRLAAGSVSNTNVSNTAAIAGTKISPNFGSQDIQTTGNVGIGTGTPWGKFTVSNDNQDGVSLYSNADSSTIDLGGFKNSTDGAARITYNRTDGSFGIQNGTRSTQTERLTVLNNGNVGIGASDPFGKLTVSNDDQDGVSLFSSANDSIVQLGGFKNSTDGAATITYNRTDGSFGIQNGTRSTQTERLTVLNNGNVGIGASDPFGKLTVSNDDQDGVSLFSSANDSIVQLGGFVNSTDGAARITYNRTDGSFGIQNGTRSTQTKRLTILNDGNVGIGTSDPFGKLTVSNDDQDGVSLFSSANDSIVQLGGFVNSTEGSSRIRYYRDTGLFEFSTGTRDTQTQRMFIDGDGQIGLGSGLSGNALNAVHINGGLRYTSPNTAGTGTYLVIDANGDIKALGSSLRYKNSIEDYNKGLEELKQLRPVTYKFNNEDVVTAGFIAEEVDAIGMDEYVIKNSEGQPDSLNYGQMVALLVNGIKELSSKVDNLEEKLQELQGK